MPARSAIHCFLCLLVFDAVEANKQFVVRVRRTPVSVVDAERTDCGFVAPEAEWKKRKPRASSVVSIEPLIVLTSEERLKLDKKQASICINSTNQYDLTLRSAAGFT